MKFNKSSRDMAAMQSISYKFPIGETEISAIIRKDASGKVYYTRIEIVRAQSIPDHHSPCYHCSYRDFGQTCAGDKCEELKKYILGE